MRSYLKKLGSRKFQAYLAITVVNIITAYLTWTGEVEVSARIEGYMPLINLIVQLVTTAVYQWVEGRVDKAKLQMPDNKTPENNYR